MSARAVKHFDLISSLITIFICLFFAWTIVFVGKTMANYMDFDFKPMVKGVPFFLFVAVVVFALAKCV